MVQYQYECVGNTVEGRRFSAAHRSTFNTGFSPLRHVHFPYGIFMGVR